MGDLTLGQTIIVIAGALIGLASLVGAINQIVDTYNRLKKPGKAQDDRLTQHDNEIVDINRKLANDKAKLDAQEESNRLIMRSIMALLSHGLNGNNVAEMKKANDQLQEYLINH